METKKCGACKKDLPVNLFGKTKQTKSGLQWACKLCRKKAKDFKTWGGTERKVIDLPGEIWVNVPEPEFKDGYMVSNFCRVKTISRRVSNSNSGYVTIPEILKKPQLRKGYCFVGLQNRDFRKQYTVHRLAAKAFIPNPQNKPQVNHINGFKHDNRLENFEWVTNGENQIHAVKIGLKRPITAYYPQAKITKEQVLEIRRLFSAGVRRSEIAKKYSLSECHIYDIASRRSWPDV